MPEIRETKNDRRLAAREKAAQERVALAKRAKRTRRITQFSIGAVIVAIVAIITLVIVNGNVTAANAFPKNMASNGIVITKGLKAVRTAAPTTKATATKNNSKVVQIRTYIDYRCPYCKAFEAANATYLAQEINAGRVQVEIHPVAILITDSNYPIRAGNAAACVANYDPDKYWAFNTALYANQPEESQTLGLTNKQLRDIATNDAKVTNGAVASCINSGQYIGWLQKATEAAKITATPTIYVDGKKIGTDVNVLDANTFKSLVTTAEQAKGLIN